MHLGLLVGFCMFATIFLSSNKLLWLHIVHGPSIDFFSETTDCFLICCMDFNEI